MSEDFGGIEALKERARKLFPDEDPRTGRLEKSWILREKWVISVLRLRSEGSVGWAIDKFATLEKKPPLLGRTMPSIVTVKTLPDDQIVPPMKNVVSIGGR